MMKHPIFKDKDVDHTKNSITPSPASSHQWLQFAIKWTPRTVIPFLAGYYSLGIAYDTGLMAKIDRIAIRILRPSLGYMGVGAFMPTFQWYSAWGIRVTAALGASLLYDLAERIFFLAYRKISPKKDKLLHLAALYRPSSLTFLKT